MPDFLLEIGCEEIPSRMIDAAARDLSERMRELLERERDHLAVAHREPAQRPEEARASIADRQNRASR